MAMRSMVIMATAAATAAVSASSSLYIPGTAAASLRRPRRTTVASVSRARRSIAAATAVRGRNRDGRNIIAITASARNCDRASFIASTIIVKVYIKRCISITAIPV